MIFHGGNEKACGVTNGLDTNLINDESPGLAQGNDTVMHLV